MRPLAYHITWGTYGTRLHGDPRGTVDRTRNQYETPFIELDQHRWEQMKENLKYPPVLLTYEQMVFIESRIPELCQQGCWRYHVCAAGPDHVHNVIASPSDPDTIRRLLKRWMTQAMNSRWKCPSPWWAECGSIRWIGDENLGIGPARLAVEIVPSPARIGARTPRLTQYPNSALFLPHKDGYTQFGF